MMRVARDVGRRSTHLAALSETHFAKTSWRCSADSHNVRLWIWPGSHFRSLGGRYKRLCPSSVSGGIDVEEAQTPRSSTRLEEQDYPCQGRQARELAFKNGRDAAARLHRWP